MMSVDERTSAQQLDVGKRTGVCWCQAYAGTEVIGKPLRNELRLAVSAPNILFISIAGVRFRGQPHGRHKEAESMVAIRIHEQSLLRNDPPKLVHYVLSNRTPLGAITACDRLCGFVHSDKNIAKAVLLVLEDNRLLLIFELQFLFRKLEAPGQFGLELLLEYIIEHSPCRH